MATYHPGIAEIPALVGSQEVVATPTNTDCWFVIIYLGAGRVWRENPSFVTSNPGTQQVQEFLLTQGDTVTYNSVQIVALPSK